MAQVVSPTTGRTLPYSTMTRAEKYEYSAFRQGMATPEAAQFVAGSTRRYLPSSNMTAAEIGEYKCWMIGKAAAAPPPPEIIVPTWLISPSTQRRLPTSKMTPQELREHASWDIGKKDPAADRFVCVATPRRYLPDMNMTQDETYQYIAWRIGQGREWVYTRDVALQLAVKKGLSVPPALYTDKANIPAAFDANVAIIVELANRNLAMRTQADVVVE